MHAYVGRDSPGEMTVEAFVRDRALVVVVCDESVGMRSRDRDRRGRGMGLRIIVRLTERLELTDTMTGARVAMTFAIR